MANEMVREDQRRKEMETTTNGRASCDGRPIEKGGETITSDEQGENGNDVEATK